MSEDGHIEDIKFLIVDDQNLIRLILRQFFNTLGARQVFGDIDGEDAVMDCIRESTNFLNHPEPGIMDLAVADVWMYFLNDLLVSGQAILR